MSPTNKEITQAEHKLLADAALVQIAIYIRVLKTRTDETLQVAVANQAASRLSFEKKGFKITGNSAALVAMADRLRGYVYATNS